MDRASDFGSEGWRFESVRARQLAFVLTANLRRLHVGGFLPATSFHRG